MSYLVCVAAVPPGGSVPAELFGAVSPLPPCAAVPSPDDSPIELARGSTGAAPTALPGCGDAPLPAPCAQANPGSRHAAAITKDARIALAPLALA